eukprot:superscaffoldBa00015339_g26579
MKLPWILGIFLTLRVAVPTDVVNLGPPTGIVLQEIPGLLITRCGLYTQRIYVRLDPWDVYRKHIRLPPRLTEGRLSGTQTHDTVEHAKQTTIHMLEQLQKFLVTEKDLSSGKRPRGSLEDCSLQSRPLDRCFQLDYRLPTLSVLKPFKGTWANSVRKCQKSNRDSSTNVNNYKTWVKPSRVP